MAVVHPVLRTYLGNTAQTLADIEKDDVYVEFTLDIPMQQLMQSAGTTGLNQGFDINTFCQKFNLPRFSIYSTGMLEENSTLIQKFCLSWDKFPDTSLVEVLQRFCNKDYVLCTVNVHVTAVTITGGIFNKTIVSIR